MNGGIYFVDPATFKPIDPAPHTIISAITVKRYRPVLKGDLRDRTGFSCLFRTLTLRMATASIDRLTIHQATSTTVDATVE